MSTLKIRKANYRDLMFLFNLRNELNVRKSAFNSNLIDLKTHKIWFIKKLRDGKSLQYIGEVCGVSVGQVRFDFERNGVVIIDISIGAAFRKKGYGGMLLYKSCLCVYKKTNIKKIIARIKINNLSSQKMFARCGFERKAITKSTTTEYITMELNDGLINTTPYEKIQ